MFPKPKYNLESVAELIAERLDSRQITLGAFAAPKYSFWALLLTGPAGFSISFVTLVTCISLGLIQWTTFASNSRLEGVLADPEGKPVQGLMVRLKNGPAALTDENGSYAFDKIRPGPKSLVVSYGTDHITRDVRVIPNRTTVANVIYPLSIARVGRLVGMLTTPLGQPIKGVEVKNRVGGASVSDEAGRFQLHDIPVGRQMIEVQTRSGNATLSQNVLIERDKATEITLVYDEHRAMMGVFSITAPINGIRLDIADHRTEGGDMV